MYHFASDVAVNKDTIQNTTVYVQKQNALEGKCPDLSTSNEWLEIYQALKEKYLAFNTSLHYIRETRTHKRTLSQAHHGNITGCLSSPGRLETGTPSQIQL